MRRGGVSWREASIALVGVGVLLIAIGSGALLVLRILSSPARPAQQSPQSSVSTNIYKSNRFRYQFEYPASMYLRKIGNFGIAVSTFEDEVPTGFKGDEGEFYVSVINFNLHDNDVRQWLYKWQEHDKMTVTQPSAPTLIEETIIDGEPAIKTANPVYTILGGKVISYFVAHDGWLYQIDFLYPSEIETPTLRRDFEQILSSFQFVH